MKILQNTITTLVLALFVSTVVAQKQPKKQEITFPVKGECGMCEERIEKALDVKGIAIADWNQETGMCRVVFKPAVISEMEIHQLIAAAGHDTDKVKATEEAYNKLHHCCKYNR